MSDKGNFGSGCSVGVIMLLLVLIVLQLNTVCELLAEVVALLKR